MFTLSVSSGVSKLGFYQLNYDDRRIFDLALIKMSLEIYVELSKYSMAWIETFLTNI